MTKDDAGKILDQLAKRPLDTFEKRDFVFVLIDAFPEMVWLDLLDEAAGRQMAAHPGANSMSNLADMVAQRLRERARERRAGRETGGERGE